MANFDSKKYFVKDEALHGIDNDQFHYADISKVLGEIIDTNNPPFNVAIIGKWGLGKSSLINLVTDRYKKHSRKYCVQEINAWKYEKESLRRVFLKQLWQGLNDKKFHSFEVIRREILDIVKGELQDDSTKRIKIGWNIIKIPVIIALISIVAFIVYKCVQFSIAELPLFTSQFWALTFLGYCKNIGTVLFIPVIVTILTKLMDEYRQKKTQKFELNFPIESTDDYEIFLESKIKEHLNEQKDLKIITVIDDLDRLSINKIVEALDALKAFVGFPGCIFVVPFDDEIIKQALNKRRVKEFNDRDEVVESELILDKLFQFKVYLPPLLDFDIQEYALSLAKQEIPDFINEYCNEELMEKVIRRVLIHPSVSTPRQVKKLLNAFVNNYMVAFAREQSGKIEKGLLTSENGTMQIAKISVLQADFNNFYDLLFKDMSCLKRLLAYHRGEASGEISQYLQPYFTKTSEDDQSGQFLFELKSEYEPLANFLTKTEKYQVASIAPYLYLAQDEISIKTGDELQRRVTQALVSGNAQTVKSLLDKNSGVAEVVLRNVANETENIVNTIGVAISVFDVVSSEFRLKLAQRIIERTLELTGSERYILYTVPAANVFEIAKIGENPEFNQSFIIVYLSVFPVHEELKKQQFIVALKTALQHYSEFSSNIRLHLHAITEFSIRESQVAAADLLQCVNPNEVEEFNYLWGMPWYKKLCDYIDEESNFADEVITCLNGTFVTLVKTQPADELAAPLVSLSRYAAFLPTLATLLDVKQDNKMFKEMVSSDTATQIAQDVIVHDFSKNGSVMCAIITDLPYEIVDENSDIFDEFLLHFQETELLDDVLSYCGNCEFFYMLPQTTEALTTVFFEGEEKDDLLSRIIGNFTEPMIKKTFDKLKERCAYKANYDYSRELSILRIIANTKNYVEELEQLFDETLEPQLRSNYNRAGCLKFVSEAVFIIKDNVSEDTIHAFIDVLFGYVFSSNPTGALIALKKVSGSISGDVFKKVFNKIVANCPPSAFDVALDVIIDNNSVRPKEQAALNAYFEWLKKNLPTTTNPNRVLKTLITSFSKIPSIDEVVGEALENEAVSIDEVYHMVAHFLKSVDRQEDIAETIYALYEIENGDSIVEHILTEMGDASHILSALLPEESGDKALPFAKLAADYLSIPEGKNLLLNCLSTGLSQINLIEPTTEIIQIIIDHKKQLVTDPVFKTELVTVIRAAFISTDSDVLKEKILLLVSAFKIKTVFKKGLEGESLAYFKKYTS